MFNLFLTRLCAWIVLGAFSMTQSVWAFGEFSTRQMSVPQSAKDSWKDKLASLQIPQAFGHIEKLRLGNQEKTVIHIQDSHVNYEAQQHICEILTHLTRQLPEGNDLMRQPLLIAIEGADDRSRPEWFQNLPHPEIKKIALDYFLREGYLSGAQFFQALSSGPVTVTGVEDPELYRLNQKYFNQIYPQPPELTSSLAQMEQQLSFIRAALYNDRLLELAEKSEAYQKDPSQLKSFLKHLSHAAAEQEADLTDLSQIAAMEELMELEQEMDEALLEKERNCLIENLEKKLTQEDLAALLRETLSLRQGIKISALEYYRFLVDLAEEYGFKLAEDSQLLHTLRVLEVSSRIDARKLVRELQVAEDRVQERLFENDAQRACDKIWGHWYLVQKMLRLEMTREDYLEYEKDAHLLSFENFSQFVKNEAARLHLKLNAKTQAPPPPLNLYLEAAQGFYQTALARDAALARNASQAMDREGASLVILVTGGFHSDGLMRFFEKENWNTLVIAPRLTCDSGRQGYLRAMLEEELPLEQLLAQKGNRLSPPARLFLKPLQGLSQDSFLRLLYCATLALRNPSAYQALREEIQKQFHSVREWGPIKPGKIWREDKRNNGAFIEIEFQGVNFVVAISARENVSHLSGSMKRFFEESQHQGEMTGQIFALLNKEKAAEILGKSITEVCERPIDPAVHFVEARAGKRGAPKQKVAAMGRIDPELGILEDVVDDAGNEFEVVYGTVQELDAQGKPVGPKRKFNKAIYYPDEKQRAQLQQQLQRIQEQVALKLKEKIVPELYRQLLGPFLASLQEIDLMKEKKENKVRILKGAVPVNSRGKSLLKACAVEGRLILHEDFILQEDPTALLHELLEAWLPTLPQLPGFSDLQLSTNEAGAEVLLIPGIDGKPRTLTAHKLARGFGHRLREGNAEARTEEDRALVAVGDLLGLGIQGWLAYQSPTAEELGRQTRAILERQWSREGLAGIAQRWREPGAQITGDEIVRLVASMGWGSPSLTQAWELFLGFLQQDPIAQEWIFLGINFVMDPFLSQVWERMLPQKLQIHAGTPPTSVSTPAVVSPPAPPSAPTPTAAPASPENVSVITQPGNSGVQIVQLPSARKRSPHSVRELVSDKKLAELLRKHHGNLSAVQRALTKEGTYVHPATISRWIKKSPGLLQRAKDSGETRTRDPAGDGAAPIPSIFPSAETKAPVQLEAATVEAPPALTESEAHPPSAAQEPPPAVAETPAQPATLPAPPSPPSAQPEISPAPPAELPLSTEPATSPTPEQTAPAAVETPMRQEIVERPLLINGFEVWWVGNGQVDEVKLENYGEKIAKLLDAIIRNDAIQRWHRLQFSRNQTMAVRIHRDERFIVIIFLKSAGAYSGKDRADKKLIRYIDELAKLRNCAAYGEAGIPLNQLMLKETVAIHPEETSPAEDPALENIRHLFRLADQAIEEGDEYCEEERFANAILKYEEAENYLTSVELSNPQDASILSQIQNRYIQLYERLADASFQEGSSQESNSNLEAAQRYFEEALWYLELLKDLPLDEAQKRDIDNNIVDTRARLKEVVLEKELLTIDSDLVQLVAEEIGSQDIGAITQRIIQELRLPEDARSRIRDSVTRILQAPSSLSPTPSAEPITTATSIPPMIPPFEVSPSSRDVKTSVASSPEPDSQRTADEIGEKLNRKITELEQAIKNKETQEREEWIVDQDSLEFIRGQIQVLKSSPHSFEQKRIKKLDEKIDRLSIRFNKPLSLYSLTAPAPVPATQNRIYQNWIDALTALVRGIAKSHEIALDPSAPVLEFLRQMRTEYPTHGKLVEFKDTVSVWQQQISQKVDQFLTRLRKKTTSYSEGVVQIALINDEIKLIFSTFDDPQKVWEKWGTKKGKRPFAFIRAALSYEIASMETALRVSEAMGENHPTFVLNCYQRMHDELLGAASVVAPLEVVGSPATLERRKQLAEPIILSAKTAMDQNPHNLKNETIILTMELDTPGVIRLTYPTFHFEDLENNFRDNLEALSPRNPAYYKYVAIAYALGLLRDTDKRLQAEKILLGFPFNQILAETAAPQIPASPTIGKVKANLSVQELEVDLGDTAEMYHLLVGTVQKLDSEGNVTAEVLPFKKAIYQLKPAERAQLNQQLQNIQAALLARKNDPKVPEIYRKMMEPFYDFVSRFNLENIRLMRAPPARNFPLSACVVNKDVPLLVLHEDLINDPKKPALFHELLEMWLPTLPQVPGFQKWQLETDSFGRQILVIPGKNGVVKITPHKLARGFGHKVREGTRARKTHEDEALVQLGDPKGLGFQDWLNFPSAGPSRQLRTEAQIQNDLNDFTKEIVEAQELLRSFLEESVSVVSFNNILQQTADIIFDAIKLYKNVLVEEAVNIPALAAKCQEEVALATEQHARLMEILNKRKALKAALEASIGIKSYYKPEEILPRRHVLLLDENGFMSDEEKVVFEAVLRLLQEGFFLTPEKIIEKCAEMGTPITLDEEQLQIVFELKIVLLLFGFLQEIKLYNHNEARSLEEYKFRDLTEQKIEELIQQIVDEKKETVTEVWNGSFDPDDFVEKHFQQIRAELIARCCELTHLPEARVKNHLKAPKVDRKIRKAMLEEVVVEGPQVTPYKIYVVKNGTKENLINCGKLKEEADWVLYWIYQILNHPTDHDFQQDYGHFRRDPNRPEIKIFSFRPIKRGPRKSESESPTRFGAQGDRRLFLHMFSDRPDLSQNGENITVILGYNETNIFKATRGERNRIPKGEGTYETRFILTSEDIADDFKEYGKCEKLQNLQDKVRERVGGKIEMLKLPYPLYRAALNRLCDPTGGEVVPHGHIQQGALSKEEFTQKLEKFRKKENLIDFEDISERFKKRVQEHVVQIRDKGYLQEIKDPALQEKVRQKINKLLEIDFKIYAFQSLVKGADDFFLGWQNEDGSDRAPTLKCDEYFISQDLMDYLEKRGPPTLVDEYFLHEILCPILGHYNAIAFQQQVFPQHYSSPEFEEVEGVKFKPGLRGQKEHLFKGELGKALREFIDQKLALQEKPREKRKEMQKPEDSTQKQARERLKMALSFHQWMKEAAAKLGSENRDLIQTASSSWHYLNLFLKDRKALPAPQDLSIEEIFETFFQQTLVVFHTQEDSWLRLALIFLRNYNTAEEESEKEKAAVRFCEMIVEKIAPQRRLILEHEALQKAESVSFAAFLGEGITLRSLMEPLLLKNPSGYFKVKARMEDSPEELLFFILENLREEDRRLYSQKLIQRLNEGEFPEEHLDLIAENFDKLHFPFAKKTHPITNTWIAGKIYRLLAENYVEKMTIWKKLTQRKLNRDAEYQEATQNLQAAKDKLSQFYFQFPSKVLLKEAIQFWQKAPSFFSRYEIAVLYAVLKYAPKSSRGRDQRRQLHQFLLQLAHLRFCFDAQDETQKAPLKELMGSWLRGIDLHTKDVAALRDTIGEFVEWIFQFMPVVSALLIPPDWLLRKYGDDLIDSLKMDEGKKHLAFTREKFEKLKERLKAHLVDWILTVFLTQSEENPANEALASLAADKNCLRFSTHVGTHLGAWNREDLLALLARYIAFQGEEGRQAVLNYIDLLVSSNVKEENFIQIPRYEWEDPQVTAWFGEKLKALFEMGERSFFDEAEKMRFVITDQPVDFLRYGERGVFTLDRCDEPTKMNQKGEPVNRARQGQFLVAQVQDESGKVILKSHLELAMAHGAFKGSSRWMDDVMGLFQEMGRDELYSVLDRLLKEKKLEERSFDLSSLRQPKKALLVDRVYRRGNVSEKRFRECILNWALKDSAIDYLVFPEVEVPPEIAEEIEVRFLPSRGAILRETVREGKILAVSLGKIRALKTFPETQECQLERSESEVWFGELLQRGTKSATRFNAMLEITEKNSLTAKYRECVLKSLINYERHRDFGDKDFKRMLHMFRGILLRELGGKPFQIYGFTSIISDEKDYFLGYFDEKENKLYLAQDLAEEWQKKENPQLLEAYFLYLFLGLESQGSLIEKKLQKFRSKKVEAAVVQPKNLTVDEMKKLIEQLSKADPVNFHNQFARMSGFNAPREGEIKDPSLRLKEILRFSIASDLRKILLGLDAVSFWLANRELAKELQAAKKQISGEIHKRRQALGSLQQLQKLEGKGDPDGFEFIFIDIDAVLIKQDGLELNNERMNGGLKTFFKEVPWEKVRVGLFSTQITGKTQEGRGFDEVLKALKKAGVPSENIFVYSPPVTYQNPLLLLEDLKGQAQKKWEEFQFENTVLITTPWHYGKFYPEMHRFGLYLEAREGVATFGGDPQISSDCKLAQSSMANWPIYEVNSPNKGGWNVVIFVECAKMAVEAAL